jgi:superoxide reductase
MTLFKCEHCGNIIAYLKDSGVRVQCCGEEMKPLVPNTTDAAGEKHVPVIAVDGTTVTVTVGAVEHPMLDAHYIEWILLETKEGRQRKTLKPGEKPVAVFSLTAGDEVVAAYEYCNLHGLWKATV